MNIVDQWYAACEAALASSMYGGRLHFAGMTHPDDRDSLRLAFKANDHAPWVIEHFVRPWRGRSPEQHDIEAIARRIDSEAATWFDHSPKRARRR